MGCLKITYQPKLDLVKNTFTKELTYNKSKNNLRSSYLYGFNGMEKDDEVKGQGNSYTTPFRQLDPRLGRWLTIDPITHHDQSPYAGFNNNPVYYSDPSGLKGDGPSRREGKRAAKHAEKNDIKDYSVVNGYMYWISGNNESGYVQDDKKVSQGWFAKAWSSFKSGMKAAENWGKWDNHTDEYGWELETSGKTELLDYMSVMFTSGDVDKKNIDWVYAMDDIINVMGRFEYTKRFLKGDKSYVHPNQNANHQRPAVDHNGKLKGNLDAGKQQRDLNSKHNSSVTTNYKTLFKDIGKDIISGQMYQTPDYGSAGNPVFANKPAIGGGNSDTIIEIYTIKQTGGLSITSFSKITIDKSDIKNHEYHIQK